MLKNWDINLSVGIDIAAFGNCSSLESITVDENNTVFHSDGNCLIETASKTLIAGCKNSVIPTDGSVTSIGDYAFEGCSSLTSIRIPNNVTSIGDYAFDGCSSLTSVTIGNRVTSIGFSAFGDCSSLISITIPDSVTSIESRAFDGCSSLTSIAFSDTTTWYRTDSYSNCINKTYGTQTSVENASSNAIYFTDEFCSYYWYKK